uniref:Basal-body rod modification protein FlgD n=1 Tax=Thermorudis peleae TaxID=1382356 RepID=A0A831TJX1_9BACT
MSVGAVQSTSGSGQEQVGRTRGPQELGKQEFLMLLVAQLRNQDPLNPIQDREFIAQLAQLNALEQMQKVNETLSAMAELTTLGQVASFIGKQVSGLERGTGELVEGVVTSVTIVDGNVVLEIGGKHVEVRDVVSITNPASGVAAAASTGEEETPAADPSGAQGGAPSSDTTPELGEGTDGGEGASVPLPGEPIG